ncbi:MAG: TonB family protein [Deltaproteobacteria bacterium]|nr:TonB family protein [Deltaproteobacteria bacterium]
MRWDSPIVLVLAGTLAIHTIFVVSLDIAMVTHPPDVAEVAPHLEYFEVKVEPVLKPPPPPVQARAEPPPSQDTTVKPRPRTTRPAAVRASTTVQQTEVPVPSEVTSGGDPTIAMPDIAVSATGVAVGVGKRTTGHVGRGGTGGGTGSGEGAGSGDVPVPVSVAAIKTRALPKGDYGYFEAGKDYPAEARRLGIEGPIQVRLVVDDQGKVKATVLLNHLGHGLDELALERARKIEFQPAKDTNDRPVSSVVVWTFNMTLPK